MFVKTCSRTEQGDWEVTMVECDLVHLSYEDHEDGTKSTLIHMERDKHNDRTMVFGEKRIREGKVSVYYLNENGKTIDMVINHTKR